MGKESEKLHGKVDEGAATASGPHTKTIDQIADGISLAILASCPEERHALVKPTRPHKNVLMHMLQKTPCDKGLHGEGQRAVGIE